MKGYNYLNKKKVQLQLVLHRDVLILDITVCLDGGVWNTVRNFSEAVVVNDMCLQSVIVH